MKQVKVCLLGAFAVGKTSLVARFVEGMFSESYQTTVGVKIDRKDVIVDGRGARLILWDLNGDDRFLRLHLSYLRGSSGCLIVVDGTRPTTLDKALDLDERMRAQLGELPAVVLVNKSDLRDECTVDPRNVAARFEPPYPVHLTSAKTGSGVGDGFFELTRMMLRDA